MGNCLLVVLRDSNLAILGSVQAPRGLGSSRGLFLFGENMPLDDCKVYQDGFMWILLDLVVLGGFH